MKIKDVKNMSNEALLAKLDELRLELGIEKRKITATGVASKKIKMREMRRSVAQILTVLGQRGVKY
ncbi:MAG: 50S ribosomal protein L29 [Candidatus Micrarchaeaceae archaeon]